MPTVAGPELAPHPLAGVRVLDATGLLSGPYATMVLGDLGAEVIKIEHPERPDETRMSPPFFGGESHYFIAINRNKRSLAVDLKSEAGRTLVLDLASECDVLVENFRPGVADRLGIGFDEVRERNPEIVYCSISGFGQTGPMAQRPAYDLITLAASGVMSTTGEPDRAPVKLGLPLSDLMSGAYAALLALAGLRRRRSTGQGGYYDVSMLECTLSSSTLVVADAHLNEPEEGRPLNYYPDIESYDVVQATDGHVLVKAQPRPSTAVEAPTSAERLDLTREQYVNRLRISGFVASPVLTVGEALRSPQTRDRGLITRLAHPTAGDIEVVGSAFRISYSDGTAFRAPSQPPPLLGADTTAITQIGWLSRRTDVDVITERADALTSDAGPLGGIRVLELTSSGAGGIAGLLLADLGADVIRVEDESATDVSSAVRRSLHRGKRSVAVGHDRAPGRELLREVAGHVDVVLTDWSTPEARDLLHYPVSGPRPDLVVASCTGWGTTGPNEPEPVDELVQQAGSGLLYLTGEPDRAPRPVGLPVVSQTTAVLTCLGILGALEVRDRTGLGSHVDMSAHDGMVGMLGYLGQLHLMTGEDPPRVGSRHHHIVPYGVYPTNDSGYVAIAAFTQRMFETFMCAVGRDDIARDARFGTSALRKRERSLLEPIVEDYFAGTSAAEAVSALEKAGVPCSKVLSITEALSSQSIQNSGLVEEWQVAKVGRRFLASPFRMDREPLRTKRPPPRPGEHTTEVLAEYLAYDQARLESLARSGVVR